MRVNDIVNIDSVKAKALLFDAKLSPREVSKEIGKNDSFVDLCINRGRIRKSIIVLINKVCGVDLSSCIIEEEKQTENVETEPTAENINDVILKCSNSQNMQNATNVSMIVDSIGELTNAIEKLNSNLNANFDNQYQLIDSLRMKVDKIKKIQ